MDANDLQKRARADEQKVRASFHPYEIHKSTLEDEIKGADELYYNFIIEQQQQQQKASTAPQQQKGDTKPEGLRGVVFKRDKLEQIEAEQKRIENEQERIRNAAIEQAQIEANAILAAEAARIAAVKEGIAAEMRGEEDEKTEKWWKGNSVSDSEFSLRFPGGGRRGKKKSKRMIKIKNAKNKSKSKSKSRRQRQKRRRHSRRV